MLIQEYDIKVLLLEDIELKEVGEKLGDLLTQVLCMEEGWIKKHYDKTYKQYCFNYLYPLAKDKVYKKGNVHNFQVRVMDDEVEKILDQHLKDFKNKSFKILIASKKVIKNNRVIERVYNTTASILKQEGGYWGNDEELKYLEERIKNNLIKKYNFITGEKVTEAIIFNSFSIDNKKPIAIAYKGITLLGDKLTLNAAQDQLSQKIIFCALGMGLGENNTTLGAGFVNFRYMRS